MEEADYPSKSSLIFNYIINLATALTLWLLIIIAALSFHESVNQEVSSLIQLWSGIGFISFILFSALLLFSFINNFINSFRSLARGEFY